MEPSSTVSARANEREIIKPKERAYIDFSNPAAAFFAVLLLGKGWYGISDGPHGEPGTPMTPVQARMRSWFLARFGVSMEDSLKSMGHAAVARALRSVRLAGERSSVNDLVGNARRLADQLDPPATATAPRPPETPEEELR